MNRTVALHSGIKDFKSLFALGPSKHRSWDAFYLKYKDDRVYTICANRWMEMTSTNFPLKDYMAQRWENRKDPFWWSAIAYKSLEAKRVVRSHVARKLRLAFTESLKKKGYKPDGTTLDGQGGMPLTGTAQLTPLEAILKTKQSDLVLQTDAALDALLETRDRGPYGKKKGGAFVKGQKQKPQQKQPGGFTVSRKRF
ncbi:hypothetical protein WAI453_001854 [Rhynchosporium graminicola]|uniref:Uncharacterized protein n=1 Tax=Rhynchosporium graminicola TaxID=2792576 RepID=A0A1E1KL60_9HELO|nr:uncharacterized protein RCO7_06437 [Rhynchosporium commune]